MAGKSVVLAWCDLSIRVVGWEDTRIDLGEVPRVARERVPRAAVWLHEATPDDLTRASVFASSEKLDHWAAFLLDSDEPDILGHAKRLLAKTYPDVAIGGGL